MHGVHNATQTCDGAVGYDNRKRVQSVSRRAGRVAAMVFCVFGVAMEVLAQAERNVPTANVDSQELARESVRTTLPDQFDLTGLVLLTADTLRLPIEYDAALLKSGGGGAGASLATVTVRGVKDLSATDLWILTNQVLSSRGLALVRPPGGKMLSVVRLADAAAMAGIGDAVGREGDAVRQGRMRADVGPDGREGDAEVASFLSGFTHELYRPKHRSAKDLADAVKPFLSKAGGNVAPLGDSGLLVLSDFSSRLVDIKTLLSRIDVPREDVMPVIIAAQNIPAQSLVTAVMQLVAKRDAVSGEKLKGDLTASPDGRSIVLMAPAELQPTWIKLLAILDQREEVAIREYTPKIFGAKEVAALVEQTIRERPSGSSSASNGNAVGAIDDRFRVVVNELTGTIIVTATPTQQERVSALVERLDSTPQSAARPIRAFPIRNRPVSEVLDTLRQLIFAGALEGASGNSESVATAPSVARDAATQRSTRSDAPSDGSVLPMVVPSGADANSGATLNPGGGVQSGLAGFGSAPRLSRSSFGSDQRQGSFGGIPGLGLTADLGTNTLIAIADPRLLAQVEILIRQLDVRQPQVMLEVFLVSLSEQDAMNLGIELEKLGSFNGNLYQLSSLFGLTSGTPGNRTPTNSQGFTGAVLNPGDFSAVVKALQTISNGATRSLPRVLVNNNQTAVFNSVLQQPYTISNTTSGAGTTTSFGGTQDAGTTIDVRPQIAEADHLVLDYSLSLSSFVGAAPASGLPPPRQQNNVSSNATIPDGHTVVVGGIELVSDGRNTSQVPYIGDVPVVGELFKVRDNSNSRQRFYVFIRASVLRDQQLNDLKYMTDVAIRENGLKAVGITDGFPSMQPRIVR